MYSALYIPESWAEVAKWIKTCTKLVNDVSGDRMCMVKGHLCIVQEYYLAHRAHEFILTPELLLLVTCNFRSQFEAALKEFARRERDKTYGTWIKAKLKREIRRANAMRG